MNSLFFLVNTVIGFAGFILMFRMWLQYAQADFYNPVSQFVVKLTNPVLMPLRKIIPARKNIDFAAILMVFILAMVKLITTFHLWDIEALSINFSTIVLFGVLSTLKTFGEMILYIIFIGAITSWFQQGNNLLIYMLHQLGEPVLRPIRRLLPRTGMIDFSPMILAFALFFLNNVMYDIFGRLWAMA